MNGNRWNALAAALGAGYVSGSEIALFHAQLGSAAHLAALVAALVYVGFGILCAHLKRDTGADNLPLAMRRRMGAGAGAGAAALLHLAAMVIAALRAINMSGRVAAILIPMSNAYILGAAACIFAALALMRDRGIAGAMWAALCAVGCTFLLLGGRGVRSGLVHVQLLLENSIPAAVLSGALHGSMMCAVTGSAMLDASDAKQNPIVWGAALFALLEIAILCVNSAGRDALSLRQPIAAMAASWGYAGQMIAAVLMIAGAAFTISVCLRGIARIVRERGEL